MLAEIFGDIDLREVLAGAPVGALVWVLQGKKEKEVVVVVVVVDLPKRFRLDIRVRFGDRFSSRL